MDDAMINDFYSCKIFFFLMKQHLSILDTLIDIMHYWSYENPHWMHVHFQYWSLNVWCGIIDDFVIGAYFFDGTVNTESYCNLLRHFPYL